MKRAGLGLHRKSRRVLLQSIAAVVEPLEGRLMLDAKASADWIVLYSDLSAAAIGPQASLPPGLHANPDVDLSPFAPVTVQPSRPGFEALGIDGAPSAYSLRPTYVTPVKNQGAAGSCWAFATYGSLESAILKAGGPATDLSENNLKDYHGFDWGPTSGGNSKISEAYLSRGSGPVSEANDPYHDWDDRITPTPTYPKQYWVTEMARFDTSDEIKNALMTQGALYTSMYWADSSYRASDYTYYYTGTGGNHGVTIVGWDDSKATAAATPGAWLIKNSWGASWGDGGYFWLSYADSVGGKSGEIFGGAANPTTYNNVYYWDQFGDVTQLNSPWVMNRFVPTTTEPLKAVGFFTEADNASYAISVYDTYSGGALSGLMASSSGTAATAGWHTINLVSPANLTSGNDFYVVVQITNGGGYPQAIDYAASGYTSASTAAANQSWYSFDGSAWTDLTTYNSTANFCIKAFTGAAVANGSDLLGTSFQITNPTFLGGQVSANFSVLNNGNTATGSFNVRFYLSDDANIDPVNDLPLALNPSDPHYTFADPKAYRITGLAAAATHNGTVSLSLPATDPFNTDNNYYIGVVVDADNEVAETDESNNLNRGDGLDRAARVYTPAAYVADMNTNPGWTFQGQWAFGQPTGAGGADHFGSNDPTAGYTGKNVIGYNLSGDYAASIASTQFATTPAINCSTLTQTKLSFYRWLGVERPKYDHAYLAVSNNGTTWTTLWQNTTEVFDSSWAKYTYDLSAVADGKTTVYVRWGMGTTDPSWQYCGWNLDDVMVTGQTVGSFSAQGVNGAGAIDGLPALPDPVTGGTTGDSGGTPGDPLGASNPIYVDPNAPGPTRDGSSWTSAYADLQSVLTTAAAGTRILVAKGTYKPTTGSERNQAFVLRNGITLEGGYAGASNPTAARDIAAYPTILSGEIGSPGIADNSYHVLTSTNTDNTAILDGFTITAGNANGANPANFGGGMYNKGGSPIIRNCTFSANAGYYGTGIFNDGSSPTISGCLFSNNSSRDAGGIYNYNYSYPTINNCSFSWNTATETGGAAMMNSSSAPTLNNCTFTGNISTNSSGGAMYNRYASSPTLNNCVFSGNSADGYGGGMYNTSSSPILNNCTFTRNTANSNSGRGGAIYNDSSSPTMSNCAFNGNSARGTSGSGGAMYSDGSGSQPKLVNCIFVGNTATLAGGALFGSLSAATVTNCTFVANAAIGASGSGGAVFNSSASPTLVNCILWGNTAVSGNQINSGGTVTYSDIQDSWPGTGNISADPLFVHTPGPGDDKIWGTSDDDYGDLRPQISSPAADAGNNSAPGLTGVTTDLAGGNRFVDDPAVADTGVGKPPIVDMGAYEALMTVMANAGGPYSVLSGQSITLNGYGYSPVAGALSYAWDLDNDQLYDDATVANPVFNSTGWPAPSTQTIALRVTDANSQPAVNFTTVNIVSNTLFVAKNAPGNNSGSSWTNAFTSLSAAIAQAAVGREIHVAQGTYTPAATDRNASFPLKSGVSILGGYAGYGASNPDDRNAAAYSTILSGEIGSPGIADNSYHVVTGTNTDNTAILDGFTITAGNAADYGGGIYNSAGSPTIRNCIFSGNAASSAGGGMYNTASSAPTLSNCAFSGNSASGAGGGMYNSASSAPTLSNCTFSGNSASGAGGGMYNIASSAPTLRNCTFSGNSASNDGGGLYNTGSSPTLLNCTFLRNTATRGGALYNSIGSSPKLTSCAFYGNIATTTGGGMCADFSSSPSFINCAFVGNTTSSATGWGGAIFIYTGAPTLTNCTFVANAAGYGGGIATSSCTPTVVNSIFWGNTAPNGSQFYPPQWRHHLQRHPGRLERQG